MNVLTRLREIRLPRHAHAVGVLVAFVLAVTFLLQREQLAPASDVHAGAKAVTRALVADSPLLISEVMSANRSAFADERGRYSDWVEVANYGERAYNLSGLMLTDSLDREMKFVFPNLSLEPGQVTLVFASGNIQNQPGSPLHAMFKLNAEGETIYLLSADEHVLDAVSVPYLDDDQVYRRNAATRAWELSYRPTPVQPNEDQYALKRDAHFLNDGMIYLNEIMADNCSTRPDEDGEFCDWIELYNSGELTVSLKDYALSDDPDKPQKWRFPDVEMAPETYLIVFASGKNRREPDGELHTSFKISSEFDHVLLTNAQGICVSRLTVEQLAPDVVVARQPDGSYATRAQGTPGSANDRAGELSAQAELAARNALGIAIVEVLAGGSAVDDEENDFDWVELVNTTDQTVPLGGVGLSDDPSRPRKWQFPEGAQMGAGGRLIVYLSGKNTANTDTRDYHTNYRLAREDNEQLTLCTPEGAIIDKVPLPRQYGNISYGRAPDRAGFYYFATPTPGSANGKTCYEARTGGVTFSRTGGLTEGPIELTMRAPEGASIYYTTDCETPTNKSKRYAGPLTVEKTTIVRARAYAEGELSSEISSVSFLYEKHTLPVVSVVADPDDLFNEPNGILAMGPGALPEPPYGDVGEGANFWLDIECPASLEFFAADGSAPLAMNLGLSVSGETSRMEPQKALALHARSMYGDNHIRYNPFSSSTVPEYKAWVLRAASQDGTQRYAGHSRMRDAVLTSLAEGTSVLYQDAQPVIVYLNGKYWGHYNLRERINKHFIAQHEGYTDPDAIDLIKGERFVLNGSFDAYSALLEYIRTHDLQKPEVLDYVLSQVDVDNYFDYVILEMYVGNTDTGNLRYYREQREGAKWHWILYDLDWAFNILDTDSVSRYLNPSGIGAHKNVDNTIIRALMKVPAMRDKFLRRFGEMLRTNCDTRRVLAKIDAYEAQMLPEMERHMKRWGTQSVEDWQYDVQYLRNYAISRPKLLLQFIKEYYNLTGAQVSEYFDGIQFVEE